MSAERAVEMAAREVSMVACQIREEVTNALARATERKPVAGYSVNGDHHVVCSDGSCWFGDDRNGEWHEMPPVPGTPRAKQLEREQDAGGDDEH